MLVSFDLSIEVPRESREISVALVESGTPREDRLKPEVAWYPESAFWKLSSVLVGVCSVIGFGNRTDCNAAGIKKKEAIGMEPEVC